MNRVAKDVLRAFAGSLLTVATVFGAGFGLVVVLGLSDMACDSTVPGSCLSAGLSRAPA